MKYIKCLLILLMTIFFAGCPTTRASLKGLTLIPETGNYIHNNSKFNFPLSVDNFQRSDNIREYDSSGNDVSVQYHIDESDRKIIATVYVYPALKEYSITPIPKFGSTPQWFINQHFDEIKLAIEERYRARLLSDGEIIVKTSLIPNKGRKAIFEWDAINGEIVLDHAYLFVKKGWFIKYRVSYPSKYAESVEPDIENFIKKIIQLNS